jgi:Holliday junction resolvase RusA-like endonuclease
MKIVLENIEPLPQPRPRFSGGRCYEPAKIKSYKSAVATAGKVAMCGKNLIENPVKVSLKLWRKFKPTSRRFGDFDNHAKSICDALNGVVWLDDSQVVSATVEKYQSAVPKVEIEINPA